MQQTKIVCLCGAMFVNVPTKNTAYCMTVRKAIYNGWGECLGDTDKDNIIYCPDCFKKHMNDEPSCFCNDYWGTQIGFIKSKYYKNVVITCNVWQVINK